MSETICVQERLPPGAAAVLINQNHTYTDLFMTISATEKRLFDAIDGNRTIGDILEIATAVLAGDNCNWTWHAPSSNGSGGMIRWYSTHLPRRVARRRFSNAHWKWAKCDFGSIWILPTISPWGSDWAWSLPLIVVTVIFHAYFLGLLNQRVTSVLEADGGSSHRRRVAVSWSVGLRFAPQSFTLLKHQCGPPLYFLLGALPNRKNAMLYSLGAMTTYGNAHLNLESQWQLMGSLEALNGWILFGLTTAFLFTVIREVWSYSNQSP